MTMVLLEFNEVQQAFHINRGREEKNTFNWVILECCRDRKEAIAYSRYLKKLKAKEGYISVKRARELVKDLNEFLTDYVIACRERAEIINK